MNILCETVQSHLLEADDSRVDQSGPSDLNEHIATCSTCRDFATRLNGVEAFYRSIPMPAKSGQAEFIAAHETIVSKPASHSARRWSLAVAFSVLFGTAAMLLIPSPAAVAAPAAALRFMIWSGARKRCPHR